MMGGMVQDFFTLSQIEPQNFSWEFHPWGWGFIPNCSIFLYVVPDLASELFHGGGASPLCLLNFEFSMQNTTAEIYTEFWEYFEKKANFEKRVRFKREVHAIEIFHKKSI